jgi:hypothetical protein
MFDTRENAKAWLAAHEVFSERQWGRISEGTISVSNDGAVVWKDKAYGLEHVLQV